MGIIKKWADDIKVKTKDMDREAKVEYVMNYYWYHILLGTLFMGLLILGIYHVTWGRKKIDFSMVAVNQDINYERDEKIQETFAAFAGIPAKNMQVDSDFMISYGDVQLEGINESSYEKFFFNWSAGTLDAVIMPESFYEYCKQQRGKFIELADLTMGGFLEEMADEAQGDLFLEENGKYTGVYVDQTYISDYFQKNMQDRYVLVFPETVKHKKAAGKFLEYALQGK